MKIAITGAHRVGKTTLAELLQESLPGYEYRPEPYHELEETGHTFAAIPGPDDYLLQLDHSIRQVRKNATRVIFDRCPLDLLAYTMATGGPGAVHALYEQVQQVMQEIDLLVFVPIEEPDLVSCPDDALPELRFRVNGLLHEWISDLDIMTITVNGPLPNRKNQVMKKVTG